MHLSARVFSAACIFSFAAMLPLGAARGQDGCVEVAFEAGKSEIFIFGIAPAEGVVCYRMQAAPGQRYTLKVVNGRNIVLAIPGVDDGVDEISFTARRRLYEIRVTQLMRSISREAFRIRVNLGTPAARAEPAPKADPEAGRDSAPSGGERTKRTGEVAASVPAAQRAEAERALEILRRADFTLMLAECAKEFRWSLGPGGGLNLSLNPHTLSYADRERLHIVIQGLHAEHGAGFTLYTLVRARDVRGVYAAVCMPCLGNLQKGRPQYGMPNREEVRGPGVPCPGGSVAPKEPARPAPSALRPRADENSGDAAILRAKVMRYAAASLRSSGLPTGAATPEITLVDLNNDGLPEGIGILRGGMTCAARGCTAFVLDLGPVEARNIGDFIAETLQPLATRTNSWRDLAVNGRRVTYRGGRY